MIKAPLAVLAVAAAVIGACSPRGADSAPARPPAGVEVVTLEPRPVERATDYVATVKSRGSTVVQPQVQGFVTRIAVRSGDRVRRGDLLIEIDSDRQAAFVRSLESVRAAREADLEYARQQAERQRILVEAGAASEQELEQAETARRTTEAQLQAVVEQIQEERVQLAYHRVTASVAGIVGDVPVRIGDRVTPETVLTTLDSNETLELYVHVPVATAAGLVPGLAVKLLDDAGREFATTAVEYVSQQVDSSTQSILAKASLPDDAGLRAGQFVRARVVWRQDAGLTVPVTAVSRINGRYFAFVAEEAEGRTVARQRLLELGPIVGSDYVLLEGLVAGERLIVSGVQKIGDGAPVEVHAPGQGG